MNAKRTYENKTLRTLDQSQLASSNNKLDIDSLAEDLSPKSYVKSRGTNLSLNEEFVKHDSEPQLLGECTRYSKAIKQIKIERS